MDDNEKLAEAQITGGEDFQQRITRRFEYLDGLIGQPRKTFHITGLVPSIFTLDLSGISGETEESQRDYQRACGLFVGYLRDIYAVLTGHSNTVFNTLSGMGEDASVQFQKRVAGLAEELKRLSTQVLLGKQK